MTKYTMTEAEAIEWVREHDDSDEIDPLELEAAFLALYGRPADDTDRAQGLWSHCCAARDTLPAPESPDGRPDGNGQLPAADDLPERDCGGHRKTMTPLTKTPA